MSIPLLSELIEDIREIEFRYKIIKIETTRQNELTSEKKSACFVDHTQKITVLSWARMYYE